MKNSNKVIISFTVVMLVSILWIDLSLKNAYAKIDLSDAFKNYEHIAITPFNHLELRGGNGFSIEIIQTDSLDLRVLSSRKSFLNIAYRHDTLVIHFAVGDNMQNRNPEILPKGLILYTPTVKSIHTDGTSNILNHLNVDDLLLTQTSQSSTFINNVTARRLRVDAHHNSICNLDVNVSVQDLELRLKNNAAVYLGQISYDHLSPKLSDDAQLIFNGQSVDMLNH